MPIYEFVCGTCQDVVEKIQHFDDPAPECTGCGQPRRMAVSGFGIVGTGVLSKKYNDPKKDYYHQEGHWAKDIDPKTGKRTVPIFIDTFQKQREYCKRNNFYDPGEVGQVEMVGNNGKDMSCRGLPGSW